MAKVIDYYLSLMSPWSYLGAARFADILRRAGATAVCKPVDFGRIFPASGGLPLGKRAPQRQAYRMMELRRWRDRLGKVMRIALVTERIRRNSDGDEVPGLQPQPEDMLADATQGGARAVHQEDLLGTLEVGKKADLLVVDTQRAHLVPAGRILSAVVHSGHPGDIASVMIDGQFVMRDRTVLTMDEDRIIREADAVGRRVWGQVLEAGPITVPRLRRQL